MIRKWILAALLALLPGLVLAQSSQFNSTYPTGASAAVTGTSTYTFSTCSNSTAGSAIASA